MVTRDEDGAPLGHSAPYPDREGGPRRQRLRSARRQRSTPDPLRRVAALAGSPRRQPHTPNRRRSRCHSPDPPTHTARHLAAPSPPALRDGHPHVASLPSYETAHAAVDYLATLAAMTGDPQRAGRVTDTTLAGDRECACQTLGAHCLHYQIDDPDDRSPTGDCPSASRPVGGLQQRRDPRSLAGRLTGPGTPPRWD